MGAVTTPVRATASSPRLSTTPRCARARSAFGVPARPTVRTRVRRRAARPVVSGAASSDGDAPSDEATRDPAPRVVPGTFAAGDTVASAGGTTLVIRRLLGRGSFGTTYECERPDGDVVALKVLALRDMRNWKALQLFEREAKILKSLSHPAIPEYVDYFEIDTEGDVKFCLVQRIAPGESLQTLVDGGWRPTEDEVISVAEQLLDVLAYLGSLRPPVAHRDVKPGNILLDRATGKVSLVDFGATADAAMTAAAAEGPDGYAPGSTMIGTFGYAAPEQMMGAVTPVSDLYSAGATLLFLLSGRAPSTMPSSRLRVDFRGAVTIENPRLEAVIARSLEPYPEDRYENAREALDALKKSRTGSAGGRMFGRPDKKEADAKERAAREARGRAAREERESWSFVDDDDDDDEGGVIFSQTQWSPQREYIANPRPNERIREPAGTRVITEREGKTKLLLVIPPAGLSSSGVFTGTFAVVWNAFVATWTVTALASGGALFALFSVPFWWAGKELVESARDEIFEASRLELDAAAGTYSLGITATGFKSEANEGNLADLRGAKLVVDVVNNGVPNMCLVLEAGATPIKFGRGLQDIELEYVAAEINAFVDEFA